MNDTLFAYVPFFLFLAFSVGLAGGMVALSAFLGRRRRGQPVVDLSTYECGIPAGEARKQRLTVQFYVVAMLFILFDLEVAFLYPWAVAYRSLGWSGFWVAGLFLALLTIGFVYIWSKGALDWSAGAVSQRKLRD